MELYAKVKWYMEFYNVRRPHQSLGYQRPENVYAQAAWYFFSGQLAGKENKLNFKESLSNEGEYLRDTSIENMLAFIEVAKKQQ